MGGTRNYGPIRPVQELSLTIYKIHLPTKFHHSSSKTARVIVPTDGRTDGQTDIAQSNFFLILCICQKETYSRK
jgi:hypothetical protein